MGDPSNPQAQTASFADKMVEVLNMGALNLAMGIGYAAGLFEAMDALDRPAGAAAIAEAAGANERYVREWLGVMVCGGIVTMQDDGNGESFFLPREHGDLLCTRAGSSNLGVYTQEIPLLTRCAFDPVLRAFRTGEGVGYENYPPFVSFMSQLADAKHEQVLVDVFLPSVDGGKLTERLKSGIRVCDLGCGCGRALLLMAKAFPESRFVGMDHSEEALEIARAELSGAGLLNAQFVNCDAAALDGDPDWETAFDWICAFDAIHDQTRPQEALKSAYAMLKPGGAFSMVDIAADSRLSANADHPMGAFLYTVSLMHCMPVGLVDGGRGLGMMWGKQKAVEMLKEAGFTDPQAAEIPNDSFNLHFFCRRPA